MSLINQMLRDLEQRRVQDSDNNFTTLDSLGVGSAVDAPVNSRSYMKLALLLVAFIALGFLILFYLSNYFQGDKRLLDTEPAQVINQPKVTIYKPPVEVPLILEQQETKPIEKEKEVIANTFEPVSEDVPEKIIEKENSILDVPDTEIKILTVFPSPLYATGNREIIAIYGEGFVEPLSVTMTWGAGRAPRELEPWQVKVISETEMQLHVNLGTAEDNWQLLIKHLDGSQQATYKFIVEAMKLPQKTPERKPEMLENKVAQEQPVTSFTKTNRTLSNQEQAKIVFSKANILIQQAKINKAKQLLRQALVLDPSYVQARQTLATILLRQQAYDEAIEILELGRTQHPEHITFTLLLARIYTERGQDPLAVELLEGLQPEVVPNREYYALLAALYQRSAKYKDAADVYKKLLVGFPSNAIWWMGLGLSLQSLQQNKDALEAYNKSLQTQGLTAELRRFIKTRISQLSSEGSES